MRVEAVDHTFPVEEQQPVLATTTRGEEQQLKLAGAENLMVVKDTGDLAVTPRQMPRKLEHAIRAHTHPTPLRGPRS